MRSRIVEITKNGKNLKITMTFSVMKRQESDLQFISSDETVVNNYTLVSFDNNSAMLETPVDGKFTVLFTDIGNSEYDQVFKEWLRENGANV
jgi:hypothetical protein